MAQPAFHFAVGATCASLITLAVGPLRRRFYRIGGLLALLGGLWACLPDIDHLLRLLPWRTTGEIANIETAHADSPLWNLFFFHGWLDAHYAGHGTIIGLVWVVGLVGLFFWLSARRIAKLEGELAEGLASRPVRTTEADKDQSKGHSC